jgi:hypothetical protein
MVANAVIVANGKIYGKVSVEEIISARCTGFIKLSTLKNFGPE